jgi:hypothetical protein
MNRRTVLSLAAATAATQTLPSVANAQTDAFESGGLGLSIPDWETMLGQGEAGQTYMSFALDDGNFWVGAAGDSHAVDYIERNYADPNGVPLADAQQEAVTLVPADARIQESFVANYAEILHGSQIDRYQSKSLPARFNGDTARSHTRNFVIMYELSPALEAFDYVVTRYFVIAGTKPNS